MKRTINKYEFMTAFETMGRGNQFSYEALDWLFDYYERLEEELDTEFELDVIAICCEWAECDDCESFIEAYGHMLDREEEEDDEDYAERLVEELEQRTTVAVLGSSYLIAEF